MQKIKQKTRKGAVRRFKITGSGKVMRRKQDSRHLLRNKSKKNKRTKRLMVEVKGKWARKVKRMLGIA
ncbi:MAG: 50S ribosomal protein L35 [Candidatus Pacebacteria bacterium]|jgi:large subunit ribosomal protein L35|nr:50S ribosomal protein L35 [Candidatus Paceibacterota bacterium]MBT4652651.1 50S ribosomal protein L35 [Candidatus Paceibacterota bacterium]MBT6755808.1 50S ribosomal protein L35 [Candidatus Paceibacterota bacterium]MBT6921021.1 50S ribosomal protein L35 [Candidatus Paceibacterota bacterium]